MFYTCKFPSLSLSLCVFFLVFLCVCKFSIQLLAVSFSTYSINFNDVKFGFIFQAKHNTLDLHMVSCRLLEVIVQRIFKLNGNKCIGISYTDFYIKRIMQCGGGTLKCDRLARKRVEEKRRATQITL